MALALAQALMLVLALALTIYSGAFALASPTTLQVCDFGIARFKEKTFMSTLHIQAR